MGARASPQGDVSRRSEDRLSAMSAGGGLIGL
jgi:hypothetical protein